METTRTLDEAYNLARYYQSQLHEEPGTEDIGAFIEHRRTGVTLTIYIPHVLPVED